MANITGLYRYKPDNITDEVWESWIVDYFYNHSMADPTVFNEWWYDKVSFDALGKLVVDKVEAPRRSEGRKARKPGIYPWGKPDISASLQTYGALHWGTEFGWQRKWVDSPRGRKFGWAGNFILVLAMGREYFQFDRTFRIGGKTYEKWAMKDMLACAFALLREAERRKDTVTLLTSPRKWLVDWDKFWYNQMLHNMTSQRMTVRFYDRSGEPIIIGRTQNGHNVDTEGVWLTPFGGRILPDRKGFDMDATFDWWNYHIKTNYASQMRSMSETGWWWLDDMGITSQRTDTTYNNGLSIQENKDRRMMGGNGNIAPPIFRNSTDYAGMKKLLLKMPNFGTSEYGSLNTSTYRPEFLFQYLVNNLGEFSKTERTTIVVLGQTDYPQMLNTAWKAMETLNRKADIWFFDIGDRDKEGEFFGREAIRNDATRIVDGVSTGVPLMIQGGKRLFNYVYIENIADLTATVLRAMRGKK